MVTAIMAVLVIAAAAMWSFRARGGSIAGTGRTGRTGQRPAKKACKWEPMGEPRGRLREFRCRTCGVTAFSQQASGPDLCKKGLADNGRLT